MASPVRTRDTASSPCWVNAGRARPPARPRAAGHRAGRRPNRTEQAPYFETRPRIPQEPVAGPKQRVRGSTGQGLASRGMTDQTNSRLAPGDHAPEFTLTDSYGKSVSLSDYRGRSVVVYFYPAASTPGCTKEACDFRDSLADLNNAGFDVLGISPDKPEKLARFRDAQGLTFPLLSDPDRAVLSAWGAFGEKKNYGRTVMGVIRSTFVVGPDGLITQALYNVRATGHVDRLRKDLGI